MQIEVYSIKNNIKAIYDDVEDVLKIDSEILLDFKKNYPNYLEYTKFFINTSLKHSWISFQFIPTDRDLLNRKFAIITAHNPKNIVLNQFDNFIRNSYLQREIVKRGYEHYISVGELYYHSEDSFIIFDISKDSAIEIANLFEQESIFYNDSKSISILNCATKEDVLYYNYQKLLGDY